MDGISFDNMPRSFDFLPSWAEPELLSTDGIIFESTGGPVLFETMDVLMFTLMDDVMFFPNDVLPSANNRLAYEDGVLTDENGETLTW